MENRNRKWCTYFNKLKKKIRHLNKMVFRGGYEPWTNKYYSFVAPPSLWYIYHKRSHRQWLLAYAASHNKSARCSNAQ